MTEVEKLQHRIANTKRLNRKSFTLGVNDAEVLLDEIRRTQKPKQQESQTLQVDIVGEQF